MTRRATARRAHVPSERDHAITALRAEHARLVMAWYPDGGAPSYLITDLEHDAAAINAHADGAPFGWIVNESGTHLLHAGERWHAPSVGGDAWRCLTCARTGRHPGRDDAIAPDRCPSCDSERYPDHGPHVISNIGAIVARAHRGTDLRFYVWDGAGLASLASAELLDERLTALDPGARKGAS